ncbi:Hypothetical protein, putative, partial [Bodo saltans]
GKSSKPNGKKSKRGSKSGKGGGADDDVAVPDPLQLIADKWLLCTGRFAVPPDVALAAWRTITERYLEPQRHYHTLRHVQELLQQMDLVESEIENPHAVLLMIFYHDVIYDPTAKDNEDKSAELFDQLVLTCKGLIPEKIATLVRDGIMFTKHHMNCPTWAHKDIKHFLDMDIAILGANKERYVEYMRQIRQEYRHVPHDVFGKARAAVLQTFLTVSRLYKTDFFFNKYEAIARSNLQYEISVLTTPEVASGRLTISDVAEVMQFLDANHRINSAGTCPVVVHGASRSDAASNSMASVSTSATAISGAAAVAHAHSIAASLANNQLVRSVIAGVSRPIPGALEDPLALSEADVLHCVTMNMDMCLAYRDDRTKRITCALLCTKTTDATYQVEARGEHSLMGKNVLLHCIVTQRDRRGRGLAAALFAEFLGLLRQNGLRTVIAMCWKGTKQETFLGKQGFVVSREVEMNLPGADDVLDDIDAELSESDDEGGDEGGDGTDTADGAGSNSRSGSPGSQDGEQHHSRSNSPIAVVAGSGMRRRSSISPTKSFSPKNRGGNAASPTFSQNHTNASFRGDRSFGGVDRMRMSFSVASGMGASGAFAMFGVDHALVRVLSSKKRTAVEMRLVL